jgi:hypothetical protein
MIWVGLDLHKRYITTCALDHPGAVVAEPLPGPVVELGLDAPTTVHAPPAPAPHRVGTGGARPWPSSQSQLQLV